MMAELGGLARGRGRSRGWIMQEDRNRQSKPIIFSKNNGRGLGNLSGGSEKNSIDTSAKKTDISDANLPDMIDFVCKTPNDINISHLMGILEISQLRQNDLVRLVNSIHTKCMEQEQFIPSGVELCSKLNPIDAEGVKVRTLLFNILQHDFEEREKIRRKSPGIFRNGVYFICTVFDKIRSSDGSRFDILVQPIIAYLRLLISADCTEEEIELFSRLMNMCGKDLASSEALESLVQDIRVKLISDPLTATERSYLLQTLELSARSWNPLPSKVLEFYKSNATSIDVRH